MKAMILAAGRGKRMQHLTNDQPKPLIQLGEYSLIEWQIIKLKEAGFKELVINLGYKGEMIKNKLKQGEAYGVNILYSAEPEKGLETGGGVYKALPLLGNNPFLLTNADIFTNFPYQNLYKLPTKSAHLVLVNTPHFKQTGDFGITLKKNIPLANLTTHYTFSGISVIHPNLFSNQQSGHYPIAPIFKQYIKKSQVSAELYKGNWSDIGTPERLKEAANKL